MSYKNFTYLRDVQNTKKPYNTHLVWEHSTYGLYFVDSADQTVLLKTTNEGEAVSTVTDQTKKIQMGWLDTNDLWLVLCDNPDDEFTVIYVELDNSDNVVTIGSSSGANAGTVYAFDIFKIGTDHFVMNHETRAVGGLVSVVWDVDADPFVEKDTINYPV